MNIFPRFSITQFGHHLRQKIAALLQHFHPPHTGNCDENKTIWPAHGMQHILKQIVNSSICGRTPALYLERPVQAEALHQTVGPQGKLGVVFGIDVLQGRALGIF